MICTFVNGQEPGMEKKIPNRLIKEKSPYLLQHAYNPVDWYPWSDEAFEKARLEDKPVFLSIGYSTCHWCHVMAHESFEDFDVAALMNEAFVCIKVDREERPDLDQVYMTVCQMLTGSGGWPLSVVMTPDRKPFYAATYIPKISGFGRMGMMDLIPRLKDIWTNRRGEVLDSAESIVSALQKTEERASGKDLDPGLLDKAQEELAKRFDERHGGFGNAPKFPSPHNLMFLLRCWKRSGDRHALDMVEKTLEAMQRGGIYDHVGYGFHRYSTDREWLVPHFEKMLYDQAMLALAYVEAFQATGKEAYGNTVREIFTYVLRDMTSPEGGFYSAEDADSEGVEGKFYVWSEADIRRVLERESAELVMRVFNVKKGGNFKEEATGRMTGENILHIPTPIPEITADFGMGEEELQERLRSIRERLFRAREGRVHPHKDDKILTDWNGLMIAALARGGRVLEQTEYVQAAKKAADFVLFRMREGGGRLLHRFREGEAGIAANLDDYAFFTWGLTELYQATLEAGYLETAFELTGHMIDHFWDETGHGLFFTPDDGENLIIRKKELYDGAVPSGNSVAMYNLLRLAQLAGRTDLKERAGEMGRAFSEQVRELPSGYTFFLVAADFAIGPSHEVVIVGPSMGEGTERMLHALSARFFPNHVLLFRPSDDESPPIDDVAPFVRNHVSLDGRATAYVCVSNACRPPVTDAAKMMELME
jgi:uncharacterized protein